jgi:AraC-like DNA-binding protein
VVPAGASVDVVLRRIHTGAFSAFTLAYGCPVELRLEAHRQVYLVLLAGGAGGTLETQGKKVPLTPAIVNPHAQAILRWPSEGWVTLLAVPRRVLERAVPGAGRETLKFEPHLDASHDAAGPWLALTQAFLRTAQGGKISQSSAAMAAFEQLVVHGLVAVQPSRAGAAAPIDRLPPGLARAVEYCERHTETPPSVAEIAAVAHMSVRALQNNFKKHLGLSPHAYLRTVRLAHVHRELLGEPGRPVSRTITQVARQYGFHHLGRFAGMYRDQYGQMPSDTVRIREASTSA